MDRLPALLVKVSRVQIYSSPLGPALIDSVRVGASHLSSISSPVQDVQHLFNLDNNRVVCSVGSGDTPWQVTGIKPTRSRWQSSYAQLHRLCAWSSRTPTNRRSAKLRISAECLRVPARPDRSTIRLPLPVLDNHQGQVLWHPARWGVSRAVPAVQLECR